MSNIRIVKRFPAGWGAILLLAVPGCENPGVPATQGAQELTLVADNQVGITVRKGGEAVSAAMVTIREPGTLHRPGAVLHRAMTDASGSVVTSLVAPIDRRLVEVVVHKGGHRGPWSDETTRAQHGAFAPSSWLRVPVDGLDRLVIELEEQTP